jgi:hypothetical protein
MLIAVAMPGFAIAAGLGFLNNTPLSYFTEQDLQLMRDAAASVLDDVNPQAVREWTNPANKYSGKIEGLGSFRSSDGFRCRKLRITTQAKGIESAATYPVCKTAKDEWQLASGKELVKDKS